MTWSLARPQRLPGAGAFLRPEARREPEPVRATHEWEVGPDEPRLESNAIHVWSFDLDSAARSDPRRFAILSADERARAARFRVSVHRERFVAGRATLRRILARYAGGSARGVSLVYTEHGKPGLPLDPGAPPLHFNLSHARQRALLAITAAGEVGADVERVEGFPELMDIAASYFAADELEDIRAMPPQDRIRGFFRCWTRKEAIIKAIGHGLSYPLKSFAVSVPSTDPRVRWIDGGAENGEDWLLAHVEPAEGFVGAVALQYPPRPCVIRRYLLDERSRPAANRLAVGR